MIRNQYLPDTGRTAYIADLDTELKEQPTEYHYSLKTLYRFQSDDTIESAYCIPNIARKVLEYFLMFRIPSNESLYEKLQKLDFDEDKKAAIYKFTNDQSHFTGDSFDPSLIQETDKNVHYLLEMIQKTFPEHYKILQEQFSDESSL